MNFITYLRETKAEIKHVTWPTTRQAWIMTAIVIVFSLFIAAYLGLFDHIFTKILGEIV